MYTAQVIPRIDTEIRKKDHLWMETRSYLKIKILVQDQGGAEF